MAQVNSVSSRLKSERGAELIEFALIFPLLLLLILGMIDFGFLFQRYEVLTNANREAARMATLPGYADDDVRRRVCAFLMNGGVPTAGCPGASPTNPVVTVTDVTVALGTGIPPVQAKQVQLAYSHNFMFVGPIIGLMGGTWTNAKTITTVATMRTELSYPRRHNSRTTGQFQLTVSGRSSMNRSTRTLVVVIIAVGVAAIASFGVFRAIQKMPVREVEVRSLYQVVAVRELAMGSLITKDDVKLVPWPASSPVDKGFTSIEAVLNRGLVDGVVANEPLTEGKLASLEAGGGLPPTITEGMRALSVKVNEVIGVARYVVPGTRVDVIVTLNRAGNNESMTRVVVSDVQVLTAGTRMDAAKARDGQPISASVVTLLVTPDDAERVALAANEGSIMLTLRNPLDREPTKTQGVRTAALLGAPAPAPLVKTSSGRRIAVRPSAPAPVVVVEKPNIVETIRGGKKSDEVIKLEEVKR